MGRKCRRISLIAPTLAQKTLGVSVRTITALACFQAPAKPWRRRSMSGDEKKALPKSNTDSAKPDGFVTRQEAIVDDNVLYHSLLGFASSERFGTT